MALNMTSVHASRVETSKSTSMALEMSSKWRGGVVHRRWYEASGFSHSVRASGV